MTNATQAAVAVVTDFVTMQARLVSAIRTHFGLVNPLSQELERIPRSGAISLDSAVWRFTRHGAGLSFKEQSTRRVIDVHNRVDEPHLFDHWRLATYFGSLGPSGMRVLERVTEMPGLRADDAVVLLTEELFNAGVIKKDGDSYYL
jgi:hypothetical protein